MPIRTVSQVCADLLLTTSTSDFIQAALLALDELVPSDSVVYTEVSLVDGSSRGFSLPREAVIEWEALLPVWERWHEQNPTIQNMLNNPNGGAFRWSDIDIEAFYTTELYKEFFAKLGIGQQMSFSVPAQPNVLRGFGLNRRTAPFTDAERDLCNELSPYLALLFRSADHRSDVFIEGLTGQERWCAVVVDNTATVLRAPDVEQLGLTAAGQLLPEIRRWVREQIGSVRDSASMTSPINGVIHWFDGGAPASFAVRLVPDAIGSHVVVVHSIARPPSSSLIAAGLTRRQAAVVEELGRGGTNADIARRLGISVETVKKHLTAVYRHLGVTDRASALAAVRDQSG